MKARRISILTCEGDRWQDDLAERQLLAVLDDAGVKLATKCLVDARGRLPLLVEFIASPDSVATSASRYQGDRR